MLRKLENEAKTKVFRNVIIFFDFIDSWTEKFLLIYFPRAANISDMK